MQDNTEQACLIKLRSIEEANILMAGIKSLGDRTILSQNLKKQLDVAVRYFKSLKPEEILKAAAERRNTERRRDGRG